MNFKKIGLTCSALLLLSAVSLAAFAQDNGQAGAQGQPGQPGGRQGRQGGQGRQGFGQGRGGGLVMLPVAYMDSYLKLTGEQKSKITEIQAKYKEDSKGLMPAPGAQGAQVDPQARRDAMQKRMEMMTQADKDLQAVLTDDQKKLIPELNKGMQTFRSLGIPVEVVGDLKLTDTQMEKLNTLSADSQKEMMTKMQEARQNANGDRTAMMQMMQDAQKATHEKARLILTTSQRTKLDAYLKDHPQPQGGGRGNFGIRPGGAAPGGAPPAGNPPLI